jgi:hypothetical protein
MHRRGLHKRSMHRWHGLAAILAVMTVRRALHRIATFHRLFGRRRTTTIDGIRRESNRERRQKNWLSKIHSAAG